MNALEGVRDHIVQKARAQGYELAPWFELNQNRLRVFSDGLQRILGRMPVLGVTVIRCARRLPIGSCAMRSNACAQPRK